MTKEEYIKEELKCTNGNYENIIRFIADMRFHQEPDDNIFANESEDTICMLFSAGYCYHFAIILQNMFPGGTICLAAPFGHIVYVYDHFAFDIQGISDVETHCFIPVSELSVEELNDFTHIPGVPVKGTEFPDNWDEDEMISWLKHCFITKDKNFVFALTADDFYPGKDTILKDMYKIIWKEIVEEYATMLSNYYRSNENYTHKEADELRSRIIKEFC